MTPPKFKNYGLEAKWVKATSRKVQNAKPDTGAVAKGSPPAVAIVSDVDALPFAGLPPCPLPLATCSLLHIACTGL